MLHGAHSIPALAFGLIGLGLAFPALAFGEDAWILVSPKDSGFRVALPAQPRLESDARPTPVGAVVETKYHLESGGVAYSVETHDIPRIAGVLMSDHAILEQARSGVIENEGGTQIHARSLHFQGRPAREFSYSVPGDPPRLERARTILVDDRLYLVTATTDRDTPHEGPVSRFFDSFEIEEPE